MKIVRRTQAHSQKTVNYEGGLAYKLTPQIELLQRVSTCYWKEPKFYETGDESAGAIIELIQRVARKDPEFVLQLAKTIRNPPFNMRTIAVVMWAEAGLNEHVRALRDEDGRSLVTQYAPSILKRTDELAEALGYIIDQVGEIGSEGDGSIPAALKRGLAKSFENFDEYQFAKYRGTGDVKLKDVLKLVRPKPRTITLRGKKYSKKVRSQLYANIKDELLRNDTTGEAVISQGGRSKETYNQMLEQGTATGFMWVLRNLRNIMQTGADVDTALARITDENAILKSRQHSYRFYSAWKMIQAERHIDSPRIMEALEEAIEISAGNLPQLRGTTMVAVDNSGSMRQTVSGESIIQAVDICNFMGAVSHYISDRSIVCSYGRYGGSDYNMDIIPLSKRNSIINNMETLARGDTGGATFTYKLVKYLNETKTHVDRILIFSDEEAYTDRSQWSNYDPNLSTTSLEQELTKYRKNVNPNVWCYSINLVGNGTTSVNPSHPRNINLSGWTPQVLNYIQANESDMDSMVDDIKKVKP